MIPPGRPMDRETQPTVEGVYMDRSLADFERACLVHLGEQQRQPNPDNALVALLCDAVRLKRELSLTAQLRDAAPMEEEPVAPLDLQVGGHDATIEQRQAAIPPTADQQGDQAHDSNLSEMPAPRELQADATRSVDSHYGVPLLQERMVTAPVGGQTPTELLQTAMRESETVFRDERAAERAATVMHERLGQTPTEPPEETPLSAYNRGRLAVCMELTLAVQQFNNDDTKRGAGQLCEEISPWLLDDSETAAPPPPGAPAAFTRENVIDMAEGIEFNGLKYDDSGQSAREAGEMLRAYAATLPTEGRPERQPLGIIDGGKET